MEKTLAAAAKINLTLDILGKRADGYHEVQMIMQSLALADEVTLTERNDGKITLSVSGNNALPTDEKNLAWQAAELFFREAEQKKHAKRSGVDIKIEKRIPAAAGLAGGSTDAAAVLKGLSELGGNVFSREELCRIGEQIGSDVPFCIVGKTCLASGRGEKLQELSPLPKVFVVLAKPPIEVSTPWAYKNYDANPAQEHPDNEAAQNALAAGDVKKIGSLLCNVLESVTIKEYPVIAEYKKMLVEQDMDAALMSGSGPTVFALSSSAETAQKAAEFMRKNSGAQVILTTAG